LISSQKKYHEAKEFDAHILALIGLYFQRQRPFFPLFLLLCGDYPVKQELSIIPEFIPPFSKIIFLLATDV